MNIGRGIVSFVIMVGLGVGFIVALIMGFIWFFTGSDEIISDVKLVPEIRLVKTDDKVDTLYVYRPNDK